MIEPITKQFVVAIPHVGNEPAAWQEAVDRRNLVGRALASGFASFIDAGSVLRVVTDKEDWNTLGLHSFTEYCSQFHISKSVGYDLLRISALRDKFPQHEARMLDAGISNMRLMLRRMEDATPEQLDAMLDDANQLAWRDLNAKHYPENVDEYDNPTEGLATCPNCGTTFKP